MYSNIEKEYKKVDLDSNFDKYYWKWSIIIGIVFIIIFNIFPNNNDLIYLMYLTIFIICIIYFVRDFRNTVKQKDTEKKFSEKLELYRNFKREERKTKLLSILRKYKFNTKDNLKIAIDYYSRKKPIPIESSILAWIVSTAITLASLVEIAYDKEKEIIDYTKISVIFSSTLGMVIGILIPILFIKFIFNRLRIPKTKLYSNIEEDLTIIYLNFNKYKNQLNKNLTSKS